MILELARDRALAYRTSKAIICLYAFAQTIVVPNLFLKSERPRVS